MMLYFLLAAWVVAGITTLTGLAWMVLNAKLKPLLKAEASELKKAYKKDEESEYSISLSMKVDDVEASLRLNERNSPRAFALFAFGSIALTVLTITIFMR